MTPRIAALFTVKAFFLAAMPALAQSHPLVRALTPPVKVTPPTVAAYGNVGMPGGAVSATCPAFQSRTNYLYGFDITCTNPTSSVSGAVALSGIAGGAQTFELVESSSGAQPALTESFPPLPAGSTSTAITLTVAPISGGGVCAAHVYCSTN
jgi:hypothetical protein